MERILQAIKGFFAWIVHTIVGLIRRITGKIQGQSYIDPIKLISRAEAVANKAKVEWSIDEVDYPNIYIIDVDVTSWEEYYGGTLQASTERITEALNAYVQKHNGKLNDVLQVTIAPNAGLELGDVTITCAYSETPRHVGSSGSRRRADAPKAVPMGGTLYRPVSISFNPAGKQVEVLSLDSLEQGRTSRVSVKPRGQRVPTEEDGHASVGGDASKGRKMTAEEVSKRRNARAKSMGGPQSR
jgi:hypothetical protein